MHARHQRLFDRLDARHDPFRAALLGMSLGIVMCGLVWSVVRIKDPAIVTMLTDTGMLVGYRWERAKCEDSARQLELWAASVEVRSPWGEVFHAVRMSCDGTDPRAQRKFSEGG